MLRTVLAHLRAQWIGVLALLIALGTGSAYAANTVFSTDIVDGEVKAADLDNNSVRSTKIGTGQVLNQDLGADAVDSSKVLDGSLIGDDVTNSSLTGTDVADASLTGADVAGSSLTGSDIATGSLTTSDVADESITTTDLDGASRSGHISVGPISNGRCATINGSVTGAQPGDAAILTTNWTIPSGVVIYAQRALTDAVDIKVCNLSGATSSAISDLPVRVVTFH
jgi:hypothetical protein